MQWHVFMIDENVYKDCFIFFVMKALSLKQPWVELILKGKKKIEVRKWKTNFRGEFLIHSSKSPDVKSMKRFGFTSLPCGFILGKANLVKIKEYKSEEEFNNDKDLHLATRVLGTYGFILNNINRIEPIPAKGRLNFWEFKR